MRLLKLKSCDSGMVTNGDNTVVAIVTNNA